MISPDGAFCSVVLFDNQDALSLVDIDLGKCTVFALTPSAEIAARKFSRQVAMAQLSNYRHARCVAFARRALKDITKSEIIHYLSPALRVAACHSVWLLAFLIQRLRCSLPEGPWLVLDKYRIWKVVSDRESLLEVLLPKIWDHGLVNHLPATSPPLKILHRWLLRRAAGKLQQSGRSWVVSPTHKLRSGLREALNQEGVGLLVLKPTNGSWSDYIRIMRGPNSDETIWSLPVAPLSPSDTKVKEASEILRVLGTNLRDIDLLRAWDLFVRRCNDVLPAVLAAISETEALVRIGGFRAAVAFEANNWWSAAVLDGAGRAGVNRVVFNHNSQPPGAGPLADEVLSRLFAHRTCNELVDEAGVWSPASMQWAVPELAGGVNTRLESVRLSYPNRKSTVKTDGIFRVLHAGNYQNWSDFFPWVAETSEEYLVGMERLAEAVSGLEGIQLTFRVRPKREVDAEALRVRLSSYRNISVLDIEQNFLEQLSECDLLICHFSTTVEQALQMGKPVLLWGSSERFCQFEAREASPTSDSRAPVYSVRNGSGLPKMLDAIREAHFDRPLTDDECAPYRHPETALSINNWLRKVLALDGHNNN